MLHEVQGLGDRLVAEGINVDAPHRHRQGLPAQTATVAGGAGVLAHAVLQLLAHRVGLGLLVPPLQVVADALKSLVKGTLSPGLVIVEGKLLSLVP